MNVFENLSPFIAMTGVVGLLVVGDVMGDGAEGHLYCDDGVSCVTLIFNNSAQSSANVSFEIYQDDGSNCNPWTSSAVKPGDLSETHTPDNNDCDGTNDTLNAITGDGLEVECKTTTDGSLSSLPTTTTGSIPYQVIATYATSGSTASLSCVIYNQTMLLKPS